MKKIEVVELYGILKDAKLSGMDVSERMKVIKALRSLREVSDRFSTDIELAKERMKPDGLDDLVMKILESNESVANGGKRTVSDADLASFNRKNEEFNRNLKAIQTGSYNREADSFGGGMNDEEADVELEKLSENAFRVLVESNADMSAGALAVLYDKMI